MDTLRVEMYFNRLDFFSWYETILNDFEFHANITKKNSVLSSWKCGRFLQFVLLAFIVKVLILHPPSPLHLTIKKNLSFFNNHEKEMEY